MHKSNKERPRAEPDQMPVAMSVLLSRTVYVHVNVFGAVVTVLVNVDSKATHGLP